jgi:ankyrin repeat protein
MLDYSGNSMLHNAVKKNDEKLVASLLQNNADKYVKNSLGQNAYDIAIQYENYNLLRVFAMYNGDEIRK